MPAGTQGRASCGAAVWNPFVEFTINEVQLLDAVIPRELVGCLEGETLLQREPKATKETPALGSLELHLRLALLCIEHS